MYRQPFRYAEFLWFMSDVAFPRHGNGCRGTARSELKAADSPKQIMIAVLIQGCNFEVLFLAASPSNAVE
jgi:hypothetical protein